MKGWDNRLYYTLMDDEGTIHCLECAFQKEIVSFLHKVNWDNTGYHCQRRGKFHEI
jgi:hypothetical protein